PGTPRDLIAQTHAIAHQEIHISRVATFPEVCLIPVGAVVVRLNLKIAASSQSAIPAGKDISTRKVRILLGYPRKRRSVADDGHTLSGQFSVQVSLESEAVRLAP